MTEPFADADKLRASVGRVRERVRQPRRSRTSRGCFEPYPVPDARALRPEDHVVLAARSRDRCRGRVHRVHRPVRARATAVTSCSGRRPTCFNTRAHATSARTCSRAEPALTAPRPRGPWRRGTSPARRARARAPARRSGRPRAPVPNGTLIAACPARFVGIVHTSERYIASGSAVFAPSSNATVGDVGAEQHVEVLVRRARSRG